MDLEQLVSKQTSKHFFGQVVIHNSKEDVKRFIIDGQQRTTTSIIFLSVLRDFFYVLFKNEQIRKAENKYEDIKIKYIGRYDEDENELRLVLGEIDEEYFRNNIQINKPNQEAALLSHKNIRYAYEFFQHEISKKLDEIEKKETYNKKEKSDKKYDLLYKYYNAFLQNFSLMYVETDDINEAFVIFETLNFRGKDLETADLLKNHLLRISGKSVAEVKKKWMDTVDVLSQLDVTKYLRAYWNSTYSFVREKELYSSFRKSITVPQNSKDLVNELYEYSSLYRSLVNPTDDSYFNDSKITKHLKNLKIINSSSFYPLIISMVKNGFDESKILEVVDLIETFYVRNCVIRGLVANSFEKLFSNIAHKISEKAITKCEEIVKELTKDIISDEEFESSFKELKIKSAPVAKFFLREINNFEELEIIVSEDNQKIHLEHIMPKKKGKWVIDDDIHAEYLHRVGNLTLLGDEYNKSLSNKVFNEKKNVYEKSKITITNELSKNKKWTETEIANRQKGICDIAIKRWSIEKKKSGKEPNNVEINENITQQVKDVVKLMKEHINQEYFTLQEVYGKILEPFSKLYPENNHPEAAIRRCLQSIRDLGVIEFCEEEKGKYKGKW
jgi:uncharacterized protein with ParB-like and HNH nuclease domain